MDVPDTEERMTRSHDPYLAELQTRGLSPEQEERIRRELETTGDHAPTLPRPSRPRFVADTPGDLVMLQEMSPPVAGYAARVGSLDELLSRDKRREDDGFPRKIRIGKLIKPGKGGKTRFVVVPTTVEEKFVHDRVRPGAGEDGGGTGGAGQGEEGEVIGEQPIRPSGEAGTGGAGQGEGEAHELESSAYDLGKILTEKFQLPNLKEKGKKSFLYRYTYELTDRNRGFGQVLDKKETLRQIITTNVALGNLTDPADIDTTRFVIAPTDKVFRILSPEKEYESRALVFFVRDYSGSMAGKATELVGSQHVLIYSWLLFQYAQQVESRFILHDNDAKEVPDFYTYYNSRVAGGTRVASAFRLVNEIVDKEGLAADYNIYVFYGTDGDDWDTTGTEAVEEIKTMLRYTNRIGVTIVEHEYESGGRTEVEKYLLRSGLLEDRSEPIRMDVMSEDSDEPRLIEGIKTLIS